MRHNVFLGCSGNKVSHAFVPRSASSPWQAGGIMIGNARGPRVRPPTRYPTSFLPLLPFILSALSREGERERETSLFPFPSSARLLPLLPLLAPCFFTAFSFQQPSSVYPFVGMLFCFVDFCFCFLFRRRATRIQRVL